MIGPNRLKAELRTGQCQDAPIGRVTWQVLAGSTEITAAFLRKTGVFSGTAGAALAGFEAMRLAAVCLGLGIFYAVSAAYGDEKLATLKSGDEVYSNVTVTSVSATDVYFTYSGGLGNAKLKNLNPGLQQHFHFNSTNATAVEQRQLEATAQFKQNLLVEAAAAKDKTARLPPATYDTGDVVAPKIFAKSFRGERPPQIIVDQWITPPAPNPEGKFVLIYMWITSAEQCRQFVPQINGLTKKFKDRMETIGLSNESLEEMRKMKAPEVHFFTGTDTQSRTFLSYEVTALPHLVLIDPKGIVRFEGPPIYLDEKNLAHLLDEYAP
jgi:hypothetical protein